MYVPRGKYKKYSTENYPFPVVSATTGLPYVGTFYQNPSTGEYVASDFSTKLSTESENVGVVKEKPVKAYTEYDRIIQDSNVFALRSTAILPSYTPNIEPGSVSTITRYFAEHKNTGEVIEIEQSVFNKLRTKSSDYYYPSYFIGNTLWRVQGPVANQDVNGYIIKGAAETNEYFISELEKRLPNIRTYLTDPSQFVK